MIIIQHKHEFLPDILMDPVNELLDIIDMVKFYPTTKIKTLFFNKDSSLRNSLFCHNRLFKRTLDHQFHPWNKF